MYADNGLWLQGEFLGTVQEPDKASKDGTKTYAGRFKVKVLVDDRVFQVEYRDEPEAMERIGLTEWPERSAVVTLPVGVRSAQGFTFYFGRKVAVAA